MAVPALWRPRYDFGWPLRGIEGILAEMKNECKVVVSIHLLQRSVAVVVDREIVLPRNVARPLTGPLWKD